MATVAQKSNPVKLKRLFNRLGMERKIPSRIRPAIRFELVFLADLECTKLVLQRFSTTTRNNGL